MMAGRSGIDATLPSASVPAKPPVGLIRPADIVLDEGIADIRLT
jgi:hypothetical protein